VFEVISTCETNIIGHLKACLMESTVVATVTIVAPQKSMLKELEEAVEAELRLMPYRARIKFQPLEPFIEELYQS
jgi:hypothetical protein